MKRIRHIFSVLIGMTITLSAFAADKPALELTDIMRFESANKPVISDAGKILAYSVSPDRGDTRGVVQVLATKQQFDVARGDKPVISPQGRYVAFVKSPALLAREKVDEKARKKLKNGLVVVDTKSGAQQEFERVKSFEFSNKDSHLVIWFEAPEKKPSIEKTTPEVEAPSQSNVLAETAYNQPELETKADEIKVDKFDKGTSLALIELATGGRTDFEDVTAFSLSGANTQLAVAMNNIKQQRHELKLVSLKDSSIDAMFLFKDQQFGALSLSKNGQWLAYTHGNAADSPYHREYQLVLHQLQTNKSQYAPTDDTWKINRYSELKFSKDNQRLFFGRVPQIQQQPTAAKIVKEKDLYDIGKVTTQRHLRIWHGDDARIKPHEVKEFSKELKRTYLAVWHLDNNSLIQLTDESVPDVSFNENQSYMLASSDVPYRKMITWAGFYRDYYVINLTSGEKTQVLFQQPSNSAPLLSPQQKFLAYYQQGQVFVYDIQTGERRRLTPSTAVSFANEDHDYPSNAPGYGFGPWLANDAGVLVYDKFDVWQFNTQTAKGEMLTQGLGRQQGTQYRVTGLIQDDKPQVFSSGEKLLLRGYNTRTKGDGFYQTRVSKPGVERLMEGDYKLKVLARAKKAKTLVFSKQAYDVYPDLYTANVDSPQQFEQQSDLDAQRRAFNWGQSELVSWTNGDGKKLDGVLIKPTNYQPGQRYPVLVYFYRFMSDRLHAFPQMKVNHRPNFAWYADHGYAVFLPDIRFELGYPGASSVQALTSGVQHIIDMGVAKADAIGIQGHSWGGYQTAFAVTQTNMFKAAVTGAPVSNMTSAYSGIRHGSGLARQFQYETGQSRIGGSLFKAQQKYIENSPVFYVERIKTPMMIMFGDKDDAVPWEQGVELYLAMRRAGKDVVFLQYEDEPHHLKKYPNKLDYTIRMQQYFDHYLKGAPAPEWLKQGEAYIELKDE